MTRRTTVITPTTQTNAVYELPSQPFARRIVSACLYAFTQAVIAEFQPELKITDVEGNVLFTATAFTTTAFNQPISTIIWTSNTSDIAGAVVLGNALALSPGGVYYPGIIGDETFIPESNLLTVTLFGSLPGDTIPNLVLVTEDADEDFMIA
jgi:hypothetical protein